MAGIGDYVHYSYEHFQKYGINQIGDDTGVNGEALAHNVFESQRKQMLAEVRKREQLRNYDIKAIEEQLNFFYGPNQEGLRGDITDEDIEKMHSAIQQYMGDKLSGVNIDYNTLSSAVQEGNMALVEQKMKDKTNTELLKKIQNLGSRSAIGQGSYTTKKAIGERISALVQLRASFGATPPTGLKRLANQIDKLQKDFDAICAMAPNEQIVKLGRGYRNNRSFVNQLNELMSSFTTGSSTLHGEYAEAVIVLTNYMVNTGAAKETANLLRVLQEGTSTQRVAGQDRSRNALLTSHFNTDFVDMNLVTQNSVYQLKQRDGAGNMFMGRATQDKVDVWIDVEGISVPASVKNYNMGNLSMDVHLLSGSSVLQLIQEFEDFTNYYLNVMASHPDSSPNKSLVNQANFAIKMTVLLKALEGGIITADGRSDQADIFIINDNSVGRFRVYLLSDILDKVEHNLNLLKTGSLDEVTTLSNKYIGNVNDRMSAMTRISNLLMELHQMKLDVAIKKEVF